ncbi:hypothetical protein E2C01_090923 [Portunus trituberculatus]|uniref:Uncharacterized protein n=1 Tax=Portunus trituberculatus TaxID=210409 RepID=A0A5B7JG20_PORTR|nr:hypothetical protein [Portunus trituberculatus]
MKTWRATAILTPNSCWRMRSYTVGCGTLLLMPTSCFIAFTHNPNQGNGYEHHVVGPCRVYQPILRRDSGPAPREQHPTMRRDMRSSEPG